MNEKIQAIADILNANEEAAKKVLAMEPAEAAAYLNEMGNEFTEADLVAFVEEVKKQITASGELTEEALNNVAGGCKICFGIGVAIGIAAWLAPW